MLKQQIIETERLYIRRWHLNDADALYKYASDSRVSELALWPTHTSVEMSREVIEHFFIPNSYTFAMELKATGEAIGCIGLVPQGEEHFPLKNGEREVGYWVGYPFWGRGLTSEALMALISYSRDVVGLKSLVITTDQRNAASQRVAEKCGFKLIKEYDNEGIASKAYRLEI